MAVLVLWPLGGAAYHVLAIFSALYVAAFLREPQPGDDLPPPLKVGRRPKR